MSGQKQGTTVKKNPFLRILNSRDAKEKGLETDEDSKSLESLLYKLELFEKKIQRIVWYKKDYIDKIKFIDKFQICGVKISKPPLGVSGFLKWTNRSASAVGGCLIFIGTSNGNNMYVQIGGVIAIVSPFLEYVLSSYHDKLENDLEEKSRFLGELKDFEELFVGDVLHNINRNNWDNLDMSERVKKSWDDFKKEIFTLENKVTKKNDLEKGKKEIGLPEYGMDCWDIFCVNVQHIEAKMLVLIESLKFQISQQPPK